MQVSRVLLYTPGVGVDGAWLTQLSTAQKLAMKVGRAGRAAQIARVASAVKLLRQRVVMNADDDDPEQSASRPG